MLHQIRLLAFEEKKTYILFKFFWQFWMLGSLAAQVLG
jgi:hypothetical protein